MDERDRRLELLEQAVASLGRLTAGSLEREGPEPPRWMALMRAIRQDRSPRRERVRQAALAGGLAVEGHALPGPLAQRLHWLATLAGPEAPAAADSTQDRWLVQALAGGATTLEPAALASAPRLQLPVVLEHAEGLGLVADLRLWLLPAPEAGQRAVGGGLGPPGCDAVQWIATPASCLLQLDAPLCAALQAAASAVAAWRPTGAAPVLVAWDLWPRAEAEGLAAGLLSVSGGSLSAAFALGALGLLREPLSPPAEVEALARIDWSRACISATVRDGLGRLGTVAALDAKVRALARQAPPYLRLDHLFVAAGQARAAAYDGVAVHEAGDLAQLASCVAECTDPKGPFGARSDVMELLLPQLPSGCEVLTGREGFCELLRREIAALAATGGLLLVDAPPGWGKTRLALEWIRQSLEPAPGATLPMLHGWALARPTWAQGQARALLSDTAAGLVEQLQACTRQRLRAPRAPDSEGGPGPASASQQLADVLRLCAAARAREEGGTVVLLLDGLPADRTAPVLTQDWPAGVVLVVLGAFDGAQPLEAGKPHVWPQRRLLPDAAAQAHALHAFIAARLPQIEKQHRCEFPPTIVGHLVAASEGRFSAAVHLLRDRPGIFADLLLHSVPLARQASPRAELGPTLARHEPPSRTPWWSAALLALLLAAMGMGVAAWRGRAATDEPPARMVSPARVEPERVRTLAREAGWDAAWPMHPGLGFQAATAPTWAATGWSEARLRAEFEARRDVLAQAQQRTQAIADAARLRELAAPRVVVALARHTGLLDATWRVNGHLRMTEGDLAYWTTRFIQEPTLDLEAEFATRATVLRDHERRGIRVPTQGDLSYLAGRISR